MGGRRLVEKFRMRHVLVEINLHNASQMIGSRGRMGREGKDVRQQNMAEVKKVKIKIRGGRQWVAVMHTLTGKVETRLANIKC